MVKKIKIGKLQINFSNRLFYTLIVIGVLAVVGVGVYAYNSGGPASVVGHSAEELDLSGGVDGVAVFNDGIKTDNIVLKTKVIEIGDWNMVSSFGSGVDHGLGVNYFKIRSIDVIIRDDANTRIYPILLGDSVELTKGGSIGDTTSNRILISRFTGGFFENSNFDSEEYDDPYNRGWITITYEA
ncbi:hypothetical protein KAJ87_01905 [Candidatus Pacearchaeota archaeon]|nr:hypothetical protein [Candidatus Pacearchaeota archaeon]